MRNYTHRKKTQTKKGSTQWQRKLFVHFVPSCGLSSSTEKDGARSRAVDLDVAVGAVRVLRIQVVLRTGGLVRADAMRDAMTRQTKLCYATRN